MDLYAIRVKVSTNPYWTVGKWVTRHWDHETGAVTLDVKHSPTARCLDRVKADFDWLCDRYAGLRAGVTFELVRFSEVT